MFLFILLNSQPSPLILNFLEKKLIKMQMSRLLGIDKRK